MESEDVIQLPVVFVFQMVELGNVKAMMKTVCCDLPAGDSFVHTTFYDVQVRLFAKDTLMSIWDLMDIA